MKIRLQDLSDNEFSNMNSVILRYLDEYGVLFESEKARSLFKKAGCRIDQKGRIHIGRKLAELTLAQLPKGGFTMYGRDADDKSAQLKAAPGEISFRASTGAPFVLEYKTGEIRDAVTSDVRDFVTLTDALPEYGMVHAVVSPKDAPGGSENIMLFALTHRYSTKPSDITVMNAAEVRAVAALCAAIRGGDTALAREKPLTAVDVAMISPLRCAADQCDAIIECASCGLPLEVLTSPAMGVSSPVTVSGSAAIALAETIAAACLAYLVSPGIGIICTARISPVNMRTTAYNYGAPELGIGSVLCAEMCARYGLPSNLYGFGTNAKKPGSQAQMEKMASGLLLALGKPHMITGGGILEDALTTSAEQVVIDAEAARFIKRILKDIDTSEEALGIDAMLEGYETSGCMLGEEHTRTYLAKGELMDCGLGQWKSRSAWEAGNRPDLAEAAHAKAAEILENHSVPDFKPAIRKAVDKIIC